MLVDLDYFFAQAEEVRDPLLKEKPVVVCVFSGRSDESGVVSTANYLARSYGVKSGMPIFLAKKKLEKTDAVFLRVDHEFYEKVSAEVMAILRSYATRFEQVSVDEAYLDVTERIGNDYSVAKALALEVKGELKAKTGLTCSIGVGPNKLVAKMASDIQKPDGLTIIEPSQTESFLSPLPIEALVGVGAKTKERLNLLGIYTIGDLAKFDAQKLIAVFGKTSGTYFRNASHGMDGEPVQEKREAESSSRIATLRENTRDLGLILETVDTLCSEIHADAKNNELFFKTIGIIVIMKDLSVHTRSRTLDEATDDLEVLKETAKKLIEKFMNGVNQEARRVGVKISNLSRKEKSQKQLTSFTETDT